MLTSCLLREFLARTKAMSKKQAQKQEDSMIEFREKIVAQQNNLSSLLEGKKLDMYYLKYFPLYDMLNTTVLRTKMRFNLNSMRYYQLHFLPDNLPKARKNQSNARC